MNYSRHILLQISVLRVQCPPNRPQRGEWRNQRNSRQDSHEQFNDNPISHDSKSRNNESAIIENERNLKQCRYCKNTGNEIEERRKCLYNNSWNNSSGDLRNQRPENGPRVGASRIRPMNVIETQEMEPEEGNAES